MATFPSIQTFYSREVQGSNQESSTTLSQVRDGFTSSEVQAATDPLSQLWTPSRTYEASPIAILQSGPYNYQINGRVVNFSVAEDQYSVVIADGSAVMVVKICCPIHPERQILLGQRVTVWTSYIASSTKAELGRLPFCFTATTLYPGRGGPTHIEFHSDPPNSDGDHSLRLPLEIDLTNYDHLPGLMTLDAFLSSGYDAGDGKVLVCVRSIGPRRTVRSKKREGAFDLVEVGVFDNTAKCMLKLWEDKIPSAKKWVPNSTILLISNPTCRIPEYSTQSFNSSEIGIAYGSMVDVDPEFPEAVWLRNYVKSLGKKDKIHYPFPREIWDITLAMNGPNRTLYTIGEIEEQVRNQNPSSDFTGKLNLVVMEVNMLQQWRKNALCCIECCGIPLYANTPIAICKHCETQRELCLNPRILGSLIDESGALVNAKLVWNNDAWTQLFFGYMPEERHATEDDTETNFIEQNWEDITALDTNALRDMEEQLLYSRVTLTFGWSTGLGRLCILGVEW